MSSPSSKMSFEGKSVLVLGASSGIGRASAKLAAELGARVAVGARRLDRLEDLISQELPACAAGSHVAIKVDITDYDALRKAVSEAVEKLGGTLDAVINSAGGASGDELARNGDADVLESQYRLNAVSQYVVAEAAFPFLEKTGGAIVNIISTHGTVIHATDVVGYCAAKAAALEITKVLAMKYASSGVRVNAVSPATCATEMYDTISKVAGAPAKDILESVKKFHPMQRYSTSDEVAKTAVFLASSWSTFSTGGNILVDGGCSVSSWWTHPEAASG